MTAKKTKAASAKDAGPPTETVRAVDGPLEANPRTSPMGIDPDDHTKAIAERRARVRAARTKE